MKPSTHVTDPERYLTILRDPFFRLLAQLQDQLSQRTAAFWRERKAINMHLPITTGSISSPMGLGSDSSPVKIDLLGQPTYLADSMQFMLEYGCRLAENGAWYIMPSFRGEDSDASHLGQFLHSEAEIPGGLDDVKTLVELYVRDLASSALSEFGNELLEIAGTTQHVERMLEADDFRTISFDEAAEHLQDQAEYVNHHPEGFRTISRRGEAKLMKDFGEFIWLERFDHLSVPFYQAYVPGTELAANADLLFGVGEVVGAGERHVDGAQTLNALAKHGVPPEDYEWYVRMKTETPMHTSGFGMGIERWMMWLLQHDDIRDLQIVPRLNGLALVP